MIKIKKAFVDKWITPFNLEGIEVTEAYIEHNVKEVAQREKNQLIQSVKQRLSDIDYSRRTKK